MAHELNINLKPCPFCGVKPTVRWESWKEISPGMLKYTGMEREQNG